MPVNEEEPEKDVTHYKFSFSLDDDRFFRRACSRCGLNFKEKVDGEDLSHLLAPTFKRIEEKHDLILSIKDAEIENNDDSKTLCCPYCGHIDESQNMLTDELSEYITRWAHREFVYPAVLAFQQQLEDTFSQGKRGKGGLFSISVKVEHDEISVPVRPISGPELPDMVRVDLICCNKKIKIIEGWKDQIFCPYCSIELVLF